LKNGGVLLTNPDALRIGVVEFPNTRPLADFLPEILPNARIILDIPSRLAKKLDAGELDVALLSSIELLRRPEYGFVPGMGICSDGPAGSALLFTRIDPREVKQVALDGASLSTAMMTRIVFAEYWRTTPHYTTRLSPLRDRFQSVDAVLTIGYPGLVVNDPTVRKIDMGETWKAYCNLPFIYALWIVRPEIDAAALEEPFAEAKRRGLEERERIARDCAEKNGSPYAVYHTHFFQNIRYDVGERELAGMKFFFEKGEKYLSEQ
jgi:chorismate dehydratase